MYKNKFKDCKLLYVEDEDGVREYAMSYFNRIFDHVFEASNASIAFDVFQKEKPNIIITDIKMDHNIRYRINKKSEP